MLWLFTPQEAATPIKTAHSIDRKGGMIVANHLALLTDTMTMTTKILVMP